MNNDNKLATDSQVHPDHARSSLGFSTMLLQQGLPQAPQAQDPAQGVPTNQTTPEDTKAQMDGLESRLMDELKTLRAEMKSQADGQQELSDLKKQIEAVLNSNE